MVEIWKVRAPLVWTHDWDPDPWLYEGGPSAHCTQPHTSEHMCQDGVSAEVFLYQETGPEKQNDFKTKKKKD